jgi:glycosyltransferase involved in cell wall biosynthesis
MAILADQLVKEGVDVHYVSKEYFETPPRSIQLHRMACLARGVESLVSYRTKFRQKWGEPNRVGQASAAIKDSPMRRAMDKLRDLIDRIYMQGYESALSEADADIYIQVCAGRPTGYVGRFCQKNRKPFVFRATSFWDADLTFTWGWRDWRDRTKQLYLQGIQQADIVAANSRHTASAFVKHVGEDRVRFLPDGFHVLPCPDLSRKGGYVLWVGRDKPYKRAWLYVDLARMLPKDQFLMVGDIRSVQDQPPNLRLLGVRNPDELPEIYSRAKLLVNTSEVEGFPNVLLEAAMHGVPYLGFLDPDNVVTDYSLGMQAKDLSDMARMVGALMDREDLRLRLGKNARRFVEEHYDIETAVKKWLNLFQELTTTKA